MTAAPAQALAGCVPSACRGVVATVRRAAAPAMAAACLLASAGCFGATISARELPAHLMARPISNAQTLDLSKLAGRTVATDRVVPGDVLEVTVSAGLSEEDSYPFKVRIDDRGVGKLPYIGELQLAGLELSEAEAEIGNLAIKNGVFTAPHVTVLMEQPKMHRVTVVGAVNEPGIVELRAGSADLLQALTEAGSLSEEAGTQVDIKLPARSDRMSDPSRIGPMTAGLSVDSSDEYAQFDADIQLAGYEVQRTSTGSRQVTVELVSAIEQGRQGPRLPDGAVVSVEKRDPQPIFVNGLVAKPNRYDYPIGEELRLLDAISMAGDLSNVLADKVYVIRESQLPTGQVEHAVIKVSYQKAKFDPTENLVLMPGDEISVERTPVTLALDIFKNVGFGLSGRAF